jgi:hypothetical protein
VLVSSACPCGPTHPSTRTLRDEAAQRRLCQTLGLKSMTPSCRSRFVFRHGEWCSLAASQPPCRQRRLSLSHQSRAQLPAFAVSVFSKSLALPTRVTAVSYWLAPEGAKPKPIECCRHRPSLAKDKEAVALGSWPVVSCGPSVRRRRPAASLFVAASPGGAAVGWAASSARTVLAPTRLSTRTLRDKAAQRRLHSRYAS